MTTGKPRHKWSTADDDWWKNMLSFGRASFQGRDPASVRVWEGDEARVLAFALTENSLTKRLTKWWSTGEWPLSATALREKSEDWSRITSIQTVFVRPGTQNIVWELTEERVDMSLDMYTWDKFLRKFQKQASQAEANGQACSKDDPTENAPDTAQPSSLSTPYDQ